VTAKRLLILIGFLLFILTATLFAHHGGAVEYDMNRTIGPVTGTVTKFAFAYPHPQVYFDVKGEDGKAQHWGVLLRPTPLMLRNAGWTRESIKSGDAISVTMYPHKTAPTVGNARRLLINGKLLAEDVNRLPGQGPE